MKKRKQLTLFLNPLESEVIESIRLNFNPLQTKIIKSHVTLCREDEIERLDLIIQNLENLNFNKFSIYFDEIIRFNNGKGIYLQPNITSTNFNNLRQNILKGIIENPRNHNPHITIMHPRNSTCTNDIFDLVSCKIKPAFYNFDTISLIEQINDGEWKILREFKLI